MMDEFPEKLVHCFQMLEGVVAEASAAAQSLNLMAIQAVVLEHVRTGVIEGGLYAA